MEQTDLLLPNAGEHDLLRRIRQLAERAERTAHNRSNLVGPPPSQEHLDILAEIRALTEEMTTSTKSATGGRAGLLPQPAAPVDDLLKNDLVNGVSGACREPS